MTGVESNAAAEDRLFTPVLAFEYQRSVDLVRAGWAREVPNLMEVAR